MLLPNFECVHVCGCDLCGSGPLCFVRPMMCSLKQHISGVPAPVGKEWCFEFSVGVDCSDPEPHCIWLVILRNAGVWHSHAPNVFETGTIHWDLKMVRNHIQYNVCI